MGPNYYCLNGSFRTFYLLVENVASQKSWTLLPSCLWVVIVSYFKFKDFLVLYSTSKLLSILECKWVIWENLRICDLGSRYKQFVYQLENKIRSGKFYIPKMEFYNYRSNPLLDPILFTIQPRQLTITFTPIIPSHLSGLPYSGHSTTRDETQQLGDFISRWIRYQYRPIEELQIVNIFTQPFQVHQLLELRRLVKLKKVSLYLTSYIKIDSILEYIPNHITHLLVESDVPMRIPSPSLDCWFCSFNRLQYFKNLIQLDISIHCYGIKMLSLVGPFPNLKAVRIASLGCRCPYDDLTGTVDPYYVSEIRPIFPHVKELVIETRPVMDILCLAGSELSSLSIIKCCEEDEVITALTALGEARFPNLTNLHLDDRYWEKVKEAFPRVEIEIAVDGIYDFIGPRRWYYRHNKSLFDPMEF